MANQQRAKLCMGYPQSQARPFHPSQCLFPAVISQKGYPKILLLPPELLFPQTSSFSEDLSLLCSRVFFPLVAKAELHLGMSPAHRAPHSHQGLQTLTPSSHSDREFSRCNQCTLRLCPHRHSPSSVHSTGNANKDD